MYRLLFIIFLSLEVSKICIAQTYQYNIRIAPHVVVNSQGQGIVTADITTAVAQLNTVYTGNDTQIHFTQIPPDTITDSRFTTGDPMNLMPENYQHSAEVEALFQSKNDRGVLHVYFIDAQYKTGMANGVSEDVPGRKIIITNQAATNGQTLAHEIGHCLGLLHTYESALLVITKESGSWSDGGVSNRPEYVARRISLQDTCENSLTNGDLLDDTPADPIYDENGIKKYYDSTNCSFRNNNNDRDVMLQMKMEFHKLNECETKNRKFHL